MPMPTIPAAPTTPPKVENDRYKIAFQIVRWSALATLVIALLLAMHKSPGPAIPYSAAAAASAQQKFSAAAESQANGQSAQVQLNPSELNSYLQGAAAGEPSSSESGISGAQPAGATDAAPDNAAQSPSPSSNDGAMPDINADTGQTLDQLQNNVKDFKLDMVGDLAKAYATFDYHGKDLTLELDGHLSAQNGYLKFDPVAGKLGSLPLPQSALQEAVDKMMSSPESREKMRLPDGVSDIQIVDGQAVVSYKPDANPQQ